MQRTDIAAGLGRGYTITKYTIAYTDLTASNSIQTLYLPVNPGGNPIQQPGSTVASLNAANFMVPQAGWIAYAKVHQTSAFSGSGSTMTLSLGKVGSSNTWISPAVGIGSDVGQADGTLQETFSIPSGQISAWGVSATFTYGVAVMPTLTVGSVDIYLGIMNISSPSE